MPSIPKQLHAIWIGPQPFHHHENLDIWDWLHPGWDITLWTEDTLPTLTTQPIIDRIGHQAGKANLIRLELLAHYGGVYIDTDTHPLKSLDTLPVPDWADSWAMSSRHDYVQNAIMAATPGHPVFQDLVDQAPTAWEQLVGRRVQFTEVYGAHYITEPLRDHPGFWEPDRGRGWPHRRVFRDREEGEPGDAWVIHDCERSWKKELGGSKVRL